MERANPIWLWHSPCSGYAPHAGKERRFEEVRDHVEREWRRSRKDAAKAAYLVKLRDKYGVTVDTGSKRL